MRVKEMVEAIYENEFYYFKSVIPSVRSVEYNWKIGTLVR